MTISDSKPSPLEPQYLQSMWDFSNPVVSCQRFEEFALRALEAGQPILAALAQTQQARALGLSRLFDQGFALLNAILITHPSPACELAVRLKLERGRLLNSSGDPTLSASEFVHAWDIARSSHLDGLAVDAAHMLGIVLSGQDSKQWNHLAMELAIESDQEDAKKWRGSLLNNMAWTEHDEGNHQQALILFERALEVRLESESLPQIRIARWSIGRCLRSLARFDEAIEIQQQLETDPEADGYVHEELGECYHALGFTEKAGPYFAKAHQMLSADPWLVANESSRLQRIKKLSSVE